MDLVRSRSNSKIVWEKIMSKNIVPIIRFKSFLNQWSYTRLKEVKDVRDGTHSSPKYIDNGYPLVTSKNLTDSGLSLNDVSLISAADYNEINKRSKVEAGDILLGLIGTIGKPVLVDSDGFAIKNVGLIKNGGKIQNQFLLQYLKTNLFNKYIQIEMAGNTQKFLGLETLRNTKVPVPSPEEQTAIGSLFRTLDDLLESYKDNLTNYQSLKATMLSKMFPKAGQRGPVIRLDGFDGEWEVQTLKELASFSKGNGYTKNDLVNSGKEIILYGRLYTNYQTVISKVNTFVTTVKANTVISKGGEVIVPASGETAEDISRASVVEKSGIILGGDLNIIYPDENKVDSIFLALTISNGSQQKELIKRAQGKSVVHLRNNDLEKVVLHYPSMEEQCAISAYFSNLDSLINSHQEKISQLETLKKKLLQDMFI